MATDSSVPRGMFAQQASGLLAKGAKKRMNRATSGDATVIDMHSHFFPEMDEAYRQRAATEDLPWLKRTGVGRGFIMQGTKEFRPVHEILWDPARRVEALDEHGIDLQIICATPIMFSQFRWEAIVVSNEWWPIASSRSAMPCRPVP